MSVITIVRKKGVCAIAADSMLSCGRTKHARSFQREESKILRVGESYLGVVGYCAHALVLESLIERRPGDFDLRSKRYIFETAMRLYKALVEDYHLRTTDEICDQPYESSQMHLVIANPHGIFVLDSYREVYAYEKFWAIGSGYPYALGAMHAIYEDPDFDAEIVAQQGVHAGATFDLHCGEPIDSYAVGLKEGGETRSRGSRLEKTS